MFGAHFAPQASWVFRTKTWLPLQVLTFFIAVLGSVRHQVSSSLFLCASANARVSYKSQRPVYVCSEIWVIAGK
jgi:hypothetical protein